jgi:hypothetical protein
MSGSLVIRYMLANYQPILATIPPDRIVAGDLSISTERPCMIIQNVDSDDFRMIKRSGVRALVSDRVQVTTLVDGQRSSTPGSGYMGLHDLMKLIPKACPNARGLINGVDVESIDLEPEGPDLTDESTQLFSRSRDFLVRYYEDRT